MARLDFDRADITAISSGGILGASLRWLVSRGATTGDGGWFAYSPNISSGAARGSNIRVFEPIQSSQLLESGTGIPVDTLVVNLLGCLLLGGLTLLFARTVPIPRRLLLGAATGFCGSLTTFSTFAVEVATLLRARPALPAQLAGLNVRFERDLSSVTIYLILSLVGGAVAFWLGRFATNRLVDAAGASASVGSE